VSPAEIMALSLEQYLLYERQAERLAEQINAPQTE
jgi:hypothetical protein